MTSGTLCNVCVNPTTKKKVKHRKGTVCPKATQPSIKRGLLVQPDPPSSEPRFYASRHREESYNFSDEPLYGLPADPQERMALRTKRILDFNPGVFEQGPSYIRQAVDNYRHAYRSADYSDEIAYQIHAQKIDYHIGAGAFALGDPTQPNQFELEGSRPFDEPDGLQERLEEALASEGYQWPKGEIKLTWKHDDNPPSEVALAMALALRSNDNRELPKHWMDAHLASMYIDQQIKHEVARFDEEGRLIPDLESLPKYTKVSVVMQESDDPTASVEVAGQWRGYSRVTTFGGSEAFTDKEGWKITSVTKLIDK